MAMTTEEVYKSSRLIPYSNISLAIYHDHMKVLGRNNLDLTTASSWTPIEDYMKEGFLILHSRILGMHFIFANVDAGTGFFGGQKTKIASYISRDEGESYDTGPILGSLLNALTGVNNIYREAGILKGIAY